MAACNEKFDSSDLVINEVVVENTEGFTDDFGERNAWIEIYNNTTRTQELSSIFITNDPNDWAKEHDDEKYIYNLLLRVINVSIQTVEIVKSLPKLKFEE